MYIKLGESAINYVARTDNSFMMVSELIDSGLSYEKPIIVRTVDELDIWFTQDFEEREYLVELLEKGINLYLYKPISTVNKANLPDYIDYDSWTVINFFGEDPTYLVNLQYLEEFKENDNLRLKNTEPEGTYYRWDWTVNNFVLIPEIDLYKYQDWVIGNEIKEFNFNDGTDPDILNLKEIKTNDEIKINVQVKDGVTEPYVWFDNQFISASLLPQNIENTSSSLNNRSTLLVSTGEDTDGLYSHPEYMTGEEELGTYSTEDIEFTLVEPWENTGIIKLKNTELGSEIGDYYKIDPDKLWNNQQTLMFDLKVPEFEVGSYIILPRPNVNNKGILICRTETETEEDTEWIKINEEVGGYFDLIVRMSDSNNTYDQSKSPAENIYGNLISNSDVLIDYPVISYESGSDTIKDFGHFVRILRGDENIEVDPPTMIFPHSASVSGTRLLTDDLILDAIIYPVPVTEFTNTSTVEFIERTEINEAIIYNSISNFKKGIEFWSKTIGGIKSYDTEGKIKVEIEELEQGTNHYRIRISRYDYLEVFEGFTSGVFGSERLDYKITNESKLVYCNIINPNPHTGTYTLEGGEIEESTPEMWKKALSLMFDDDNEPVWPDFFFVPNIQKYTDLREYYQDGYLPIYKTFLEYASKYTMQFLIQNSDLGNGGYKMVEVQSYPSSPDPLTIYYNTTEKAYKVYDENGQEVTDEIELKFIIDQYMYENEYFTNYTGDTSNYLIYFYRSMSIYGNDRPGYYAFFNGLLTNNYTISSKVMLYNQPSNNPYIEEPIEEILENKKSNYLVSNNQVYYYKKYQNGKDYYMTLWMRFTAGKINRELQKNKRDYIGIKFSGKMERTITSILQNIESSFNVVKKINVTEFNIDEVNNTLTINLDIYVNDLINNNLNLNLTINYNNYNNYGIS